MDPKRQRCFWGRVQLKRRKTLGCAASSSEQEGDSSEHTILEHPTNEWWKSILRCAKTVKPKKSRRAYSPIEDCRVTVCNWLNKMQIIDRKGTDFSD